MIYLLKDRETINCLHLNWPEEYLAPLQTLHSFAEINGNLNLKPLTVLAKRSIFSCLAGPRMFLCMWIRHSFKNLNGNIFLESNMTFKSTMFF